MKPAPNQRKIRIVGQVPENYTGPIYYRVVEKNDGRARFSNEVEPDPETRERTRPFWDPAMRLNGPRAAATILDASGDLRPEWKVPLKYNVLKDGALTFEFMPGGFTSERVRDVINALDHRRHIFVPVDARWPDGHLERLFFMIWGNDFFDANASNPVLHPSMNNMQIGTYTNGERYFKKPDWISGVGDALDKHHFGYLNRDFIGSLNLFGASVLDNAPVISDTLMSELSKFGNVFFGSDNFVRMGVA